VGRRGGLAGMVLGSPVAVIRADDIEVVRADLAMAHGVATCGVGGPATGLLGLAQAYDDALACVKVLVSLGKVGVVAGPADLGPYRYLLSESGRNDASRFIAATIGALIDHDQKRNTDLVRTAEEFLRSGRQHAATAASLHIHANTLYQRLEKVSERLGAEWRSGDQALDVQIALRLYRLSQPTTSW